MLWLQSPQWSRWLIASVLAALALWVELRPEPTVLHPFAIDAIAPGEPVGVLNTEMVRVPAGLLQPVEGTIAQRPISEGNPVLADDVGDQRSHIPAGWWVVSADVPAESTPGDRVRLVVLTTGETVEGVVTAGPSDDPFANASGAIAVEPANAAEVAMAAANGQIAVLVHTG